MATFEDNFEGYSAGDHPPFGDWTSPFLPASLVTIVAGGTAEDSTPSNLALQIEGGSLAKNFGTSTFYESGTIYVAIYPEQAHIVAGEAIDLLDIVNGPTPSFSSYASLLSFKIENDCTISAYSGPGSAPEFLCNSNDFVVGLQTWNFLQLNWEFTIDTIFLKITVHIILNGKEVCSKSNYISNTQIAGLLGIATPNIVAGYNILRLSSNHCIYDNFSFFSTEQASATYPHEGAPVVKVTGGNVEIPILPDSAKLNVFQGAAEFSLLPDSGKLRAFQGVVELILLDSPRQAGLWKVKEY